MTRLWTFQFGLLIIFLSCLEVFGEETASMVVFDLNTNDSSSLPGVITMSFGSPPQDIDLLVSFYTGEASAYIPAGALCSTSSTSSTAGTDWNKILEPSEGDFVQSSNGSGSLAGVQLVEWRASTDTNSKKVNISLRKGRGDAAVNVTVIERGISNDGEYPWDAAQTFSEQNLEAASDYSLMLWTESPPRRSISGYFSLGLSSNNTITTTTTATSNRGTEDNTQNSECLNYLRSDAGGYYNQTGDADFVVDVLTANGISDTATDFQMQSLAVGSTSLAWSTTSDISTAVFQLKGMPINLVWQSTLGMGTVGLSLLQRARKSSVPEMDVVSLNLGTGGNTGSVVMGGYDDALIDHGQKVVFSRTNSNGTSGFQVVLSDVTYIGPNSEEVVVSNAGTSSAESKVALAYDSPNIQLPAKALEALLPLIGDPVFDENVNGYIYLDSDSPRTDYSLKFTLKNGSSSSTIIVPASSLVGTDTSSNNPLTSRVESGQTYLRLSASSDEHPAYLGRVFLQHVYLVNGPPTINKFLISAIPSPLPSAKSLVPASRTSIKMFNTTPGTSDKPAVGPMVGGILGGLAVIIGVIALWMWFLRRRRDRALSSEGPEGGNKPTVRFAEGDRNPSPFSPPPASSYGYEKELEFASRKSSNRTGSESKTATPSVTSFSPDLPEKDPEFLQRLSRQSQHRRRQSEGSTVARVYMGPYSPQVDDIEELHYEMQLQRTATVGRFISGANAVATVDGGPRSPGVTKPEMIKIKTANSHVRTASIGRICTPTSIEFPTSSSRRGSMRTVGSADLLRRSSGDLLRGSVDGFAIGGSEERINSIKEVAGVRKQVVWEKDDGDDDGSDTSTVFGLDAVTKDGSEFLKNSRNSLNLRAGSSTEGGDGNDSSRPTTTETTETATTATTETDANEGANINAIFKNAHAQILGVI